jgi:hypothetical protein
MLVASRAISSRHKFGESTLRYPDVAAEPDHPNAPLAHAPFDEADGHVELLGRFSLGIQLLDLDKVSLHWHGYS